MTRTMTVSTTVEMEIPDDLAPDILRQFQARHHGITSIGDVFEKIAIGIARGGSPRQVSSGLTTKIIGTDVDEYI